MKIRRSFWTDRPLNVSRREYERYSLQNFLTTICGMISVGCLIVAVFDLTGALSRDLASYPTLSVADALATLPGATPPEPNQTYKLAGRLVAEQPVSMPDEPNLKVLIGTIDVHLRPSARETGPEPVSLFNWMKVADPIFLEQDEQRIVVGFNSEVLPLTLDRQARVQYVREGQGRLSKEVAVEYGGQTYPFPEDYLALSNGAIAKVDRQYFSQGQAVVVLARIENTDAGTQLSAPLDTSAKVYLGTESEIKASGKRARPMFGLLAILFGVGFYFSLKHALKLREAIAYKSNLPKS